MKEKLIPLRNLNEGDQGEIAEIVRKGPSHRHSSRGRGRGSQGWFSEMGLRVGKKIQLLHKRNKGPILLKVDQSRIAIGRSLADRIWIKD